MRTSRENQIEELKATIAQAEMCKIYANTRAQEESDQRNIDALNVQLKELES